MHAADVMHAGSPLHLVMVDHRAGSDHDLRDGVREVLLSRRTGVTLDDPGLTAVASDDQNARVRHAGGSGDADTNSSEMGCSMIVPGGSTRTRRPGGTPCSAP